MDAPDEATPAPQPASGDGGTTDYVPGTSNNQGNRTLDINLVNAWRAVNGLGPISASQFDSNRFNSVDLRVSKALPLGANRKAELVAQVFNVFGTDNLLPPGGDSYVENALSDSFGKILNADQAVTHCGRANHRILEFANVTRPGIFLQDFHGFRRETNAGAERIDAIRERLRQWWNVIATLT